MLDMRAGRSAGGMVEFVGDAVFGCGGEVLLFALVVAGADGVAAAAGMELLSRSSTLSDMLLPGSTAGVEVSECAG